MSGDIEINKCDFCHEIKQVERTYLHPSKYVKGDYFIIIKTCAECGIPTSSQTEISEPNPQLIESMCYRYRHDFGFLKDNHKESIRTTMKQLWEEVVGKGFYKQKEISDEEIEDVSGGDVSFEFGAKWYREQLKKK